MLVTTKKQMTELVSKLSKTRIFSFDTETNGLEYFRGHHPVGLSVHVPGQEPYTAYVPIDHAGRQNLKPAYLPTIAPIFRDKSKTMITWNGKFDVHMVESDSRFNARVECEVLDGMLALHLLDENRHGYALKPNALKYLGEDAVLAERELNEALGDGGFGKDEMWRLSAEMVRPYAECDAVITQQLTMLAVPALKQQGLFDLWREVSAFSMVVKDMEARGLPVDLNRCAEKEQYAEKYCETLLREMGKEAGTGFNPNSPKQVQRALGITGTTDRNALLALGTPLSLKINEYRKWRKAIDTYYAVFRERAVNGRLHANFKVHGTVTGRLSCTEPNLMALPREGDTYGVRACIVEPDPDRILLSADASQAELRFLAHYTQDPFLLHVYQNKLDLHQMVADTLHVDRNIAKRIDFAMVYGVGEETLAKELGIAQGAARKILAQYHAMIPGIKKLYNGTAAKAESEHYIRMWTGRRRRYAKHDAFHKGMSNLIQGAVAEMFRTNMQRVDKSSIGSVGADMILQVHDDLVFSVPKKELRDVAIELKRLMEDYEFRVPMVMDMKVGRSLGELVAYDATA